jgi:hypothetical protein
MAEAVCKYCHRPFCYEFKEEAKREREREVCDECHECRLRWARKKVRRLKDRREARRKALRFQKTSARDFRKLEPGEMLTRAELAQRLGISERAVQCIEERALAKLRSSTELQEAYGKFKQSGKPRMDLFLEHVGMAMRERDEARVMDWQQELFGLWERHDAWRRMGLELDDWLLAVEMNEGWPEWSAVRDDAQSTMLAAAREMNGLIMKAQKALMRELGKIPFAEP